jgi:hypothetical protein
MTTNEPGEQEQVAKAPEPVAASNKVNTKTYTETELEKAKQEALTKAGRDSKALEERASQLALREKALKVKEIATANGLTETDLTEFSVLSDDKLESLAKKLAQAKTSAKDGQTKQPPITRADSGATTGGSSDWKSIRDAYIDKPNDPKVRQAYLEARRAKGY